MRSGGCAWAGLPARSDQGSLDFFTPLFASRQKVENKHYKE